MRAVLNIEKLTVRFDKELILKDIDLQVEENDWYMILGPNGVGKTTLSHAVAGQIDTRVYFLRDKISKNFSQG